MSVSVQAASSAENIPAIMQEIGRDALAAKRELAALSGQARADAIRAMASAVRAHRDAILEANARDVRSAKEKNLTAAIVDRLALDDARLASMTNGLESVADYPDPLDKILEERRVAKNGLHIKRVSVPIGVIGVIYESRPNVTADAAALCLKSGNACILRGGSESFYSSRAIHAAIVLGLKEAGVSEYAVGFVPTTDRDAVGIMLSMSGHIDLIIPRGGKSLCERVSRESKAPTLLHLDGVCHTYIHASADLDMAVKVTLNAKMRRPGICGATENLLIDRAILGTAAPVIVKALLEKGCVVRGDDAVRAACKGLGVAPASPEDWNTEYLDAVLSVASVDGVADAAAFVARHGSGHTDAIVAGDREAAAYFLTHVDSAIVMHNASTQFADGGEFGLGAEIGIATGRLHARGPVGADQLTTYKYVVTGDGACRA
jgi:glutamate-5-semialdehyde dehydrogenase